MDDQLNEIRQFLESFNAVTGAHMGIHNGSNDTAIASGCQKCNLCRFCVQKSKAFLERCSADDRKNYLLAVSEGKTVYFRCHFGVYSVVIPISSGGNVLGVVDFGMIRLSDDPETDFDSMKNYLFTTFPDDFSPSDTEALQKAYRDTAVMTRKLLDDYVRIVKSAALGLYMEQVFLRGGNSKNQSFRSFLAAFDPVSVPLENFSVEEIAKKLNISCPHLSRLAKAEFGMPFKQYVLSKKLEAAEKQLGTRTVKEIAASVGISDPLYFSKLFRRRYGISCSAYAKLHTRK